MHSVHMTPRLPAAMPSAPNDGPPEIRLWLGAVLKAIREDADMSQRATAHRVDPGGISETHEGTVRRWEKGEVWPRRIQTTLDKYAAISGITQLELWERVLDLWRQSEHDAGAMHFADDAEAAQPHSEHGASPEEEDPGEDEADEDQ